MAERAPATDLHTSPTRGGWAREHRVGTPSSPMGPPASPCGVEVPRAVGASCQSARTLHSRGCRSARGVATCPLLPPGTLSGPWQTRWWFTGVCGPRRQRRPVEPSFGTRFISSFSPREAPRLHAGRSAAPSSPSRILTPANRTLLRPVRPGACRTCRLLPVSTATSVSHRPTPRAGPLRAPRATAGASGTWTA